MKAVVLSGGGGAYQIGVWKALHKLRYKYEIVTGTSVGALNGALMVQKDYLKSLWLWRNMNFKIIFDKEIDPNNLVKEYAKAIVLDGGMDITNLENLIKNVFDKNKFYNSPIDFGLVTVTVPSLKAKTLAKKDIPEDKLTDYLIASASCYPAFKIKEIDNLSFIDGGFYDNLPINLAIKLGASEIIAVDLKSVGIKRKVKNDKVKITTISPKNHIGSFLVFDKNQSRRAIRLGYNDTMKTFKKLEGDIYTFKLHELSSKKYQSKISFMLNDIFKTKNTLLGDILKNSTYKHIMESKSGIILDNVYKKNIEYLGKVFNIDDSYIYTIKKYNKILKNKLDNTEGLNTKLIEEKIKNKKIKDLINTKYIVKYIYNKLENVKTDKQKKELQTLAILFKKELIAALYLKTI